MKINWLYVSGFGALKDYKLDFADFTQIIQENGYGKSTLRTFIEVMLYGMDSKSFKEDREYKPWHADVFGGKLSIEVNGKNYVIERTFGKKKSDDTFALYQDGVLSSDYTENIGLELFGLERKAFRIACTFDSYESTLNEDGIISIKEKLNAIFLESEDFKGFSNIEDKLEKEIKGYENTKKTGAIQLEQAKLYECELEIRKLEFSKTDYTECEKRLKELQESKTELANQVNLKSSTLEELLKNSTISSTDTAIKLLREDVAKLEEKRREYALILNGTHIDKQTLEKWTISCQQAEKLKAELDEKVSKKSLINTNYNPQKEQALKQLNGDFKKYKSKNTTPFNLPLTIGAGAIGLASVLLSILLNIFFIAILIVPVACAIYHIIKLSNQRKQKALLLNSITSTLRSYGYYEDVEISLALFNKDVQEELSSLGIIANLDREIKDIKGRLITFKEDIERFFAKFNLNKTGYYERLTTLSNALTNYEYYTEQLKEKTSQQKEYLDKKLNDTTSIKIESLQSEIKILKEKLTEISNEILNTSTKLAKLEKDIERLEKLYYELDSTKEKISKLTHQKEITQKTLSALQKARDNLTNGCIDPVRKSLKHYFSKLMPNVTINMDNDFNISFEVDGLTKELSRLSLGQKQLVNFSLKLGLINALFGKDLPFIVIDDAFNPLDKENLEKSSLLIKEITTSLQVIYLTPHLSRKIDI